jgi:hypothetical protein
VDIGERKHHPTFEELGPAEPRPEEAEERIPADEDPRTTEMLSWAAEALRWEDEDGEEE